MEQFSIVAVGIISSIPFGVSLISLWGSIDFPVHHDSLICKLVISIVALTTLVLMLGTTGLTYHFETPNSY